MHTIEMALTLRNTGHLSRCLIHPVSQGIGYKIITIDQGSERQEITNNYGAPIVTLLEKALEYARSIGFEEDQIEVVEAPGA